MSDNDTLPLFVLPMVVLPGEIQQLRIFEPRYRQMLDDCLLDEKNFGLVLDDNSNHYNGWNGPEQFGCEVEIIHHETVGSNHFVEILGKRKFEVKEIISPALPPFSDETMQDIMPEEGIYPDLETILTKIPEDSEYHKLYLAASVNYIEQKFVLEDDKLKELESLLKIIITRIASNLEIDSEILEEWVESRISIIFENQDDLLYSIAAMTIARLDKKYQILMAENSDEIYDLILQNLVNIA
tara:strand:- start:6897 stop:7619 length:723 start_codon:yes stop_codon:yes gene_type:complete